MSQDAIIYVICNQSGEPDSHYVYLNHEKDRAVGILDRMKKADPAKYGAHRICKFAPEEAE